jgi:hypothetical protein
MHATRNNKGGGSSSSRGMRSIDNREDIRVCEGLVSMSLAIQQVGRNLLLDSQRLCAFQLSLSVELDFLVPTVIGCLGQHDHSMSLPLSNHLADEVNIV